ncbi:MAG: hypothetical protein V7646_2365 [Pseudonocardia sp.]|jgi:hypothetical protein
MTLDDRFNELREAAKALGVADLAEDESAGADRVRRLQLTATVIGTAEAHAMVACLWGTRSGSGTRRMPSDSAPAHRECSDDDAGC